MKKTILTLASLLLFQINSSADSLSEYQALSAKQKQTVLWNEIKDSEYETLPGFGTQLFLQSIGSKALLNLGATITHESDFMPTGRLKFIHTYGSCAKVEFVVTRRSEYDGIYQNGAVGLARLGWAAPPQLMGYIPGMAIKLLVDGRPSVNLQVMNSLDGQGDSQNYFQETFSNIIPEPKGALLKTLAGLFKTVTDNPIELPVDHLARVTADGQKITGAVAPRRLLFVPTKQVQMPESSSKDLRERLHKFKAGTILYQVYAQGTHQKSLRNTEPQEIGKLVLRSDFIASEFCDRTLFFQHNQ